MRGLGYYNHRHCLVGLYNVWSILHVRLAFRIDERPAVLLRDTYSSNSLVLPGCFGSLSIKKTKHYAYGSSLDLRKFHY